MRSRFSSPDLSIKKQTPASAVARFIGRYYKSNLRIIYYTAVQYPRGIGLFAYAYLSVSIYTTKTFQIIVSILTAFYSDT